jgi:chemotaxis protein CheD
VIAIDGCREQVAGIGELVVSRDPDTVIVAHGLGSCVAVAAWDPVVRAAGMAHFMLPEGPPGGPPAKYVRGGMDALLASFRSIGGQPRRARIRVAGGASMLQLAGNGLEIGRRNAEAVQAELDRAGLSVHAADLGGGSGRTIQLSVADGRLLVRSLGTTIEL